MKAHDLADLEAVSKTEMKSNTCRVIVAEDHPAMLDRILALLRLHFDVVASVLNGKDLITETQRLCPEVVVTDITMPILNGVDAARELRRVGSAAKVIFLTVHRDATLVERCFAEGAFGYVHKSQLRSDLIPAIKEALCGRHFVSSFVGSSVRSSKNVASEDLSTLNMALDLWGKR